ncbi:MAG: 16S rRNA (adenine(1518)-N(6)/adenine(1519)-N(6))-dimethyltransferase RsmA [Candidatus Korarchaeum sp.]|nr:16S rRNA (adenine(1518)-N(6)/adenine(1519)-N(6))-dimethyltransferase RsmA [Candidatus Korarchaeum sp.]MDW8036396.1 16S rRNA (adenine(1518)-N(6)/adenine(1519)-N(6))-dimethyltransferase RsmA [Candidatus Korarchaeum sp.]
MRAKLGQHMMVSRKWLRVIVDLLEVSSYDEIVELGAGTGNLSEEILLRGPRRLILIERDAKLVEVLRSKFRERSDVHIVIGDIRDFLPLKTDKIASNPPYYLSSQLLLGLSRSKFKRAVLTFQREFAERLIAKPGSEDYGSLSVIASLLLKVKLVAIVGKRAFSPPPAVESAIVVIEPREDELREYILRYCKLIFSKRKRELKNVLRPLIGERASSAPYSEVRPYHLAPEQVREVIEWLRGELGR